MYVTLPTLKTSIFPSLLGLIGSEIFNYVSFASLTGIKVTPSITIFF
jgi:hypothetical protein